MPVVSFELVGLGRSLAPSNIVAGRVEGGESDYRAVTDSPRSVPVLHQQRARRLPPATTSRLSDLVPHDMAWIEPLKATGPKAGCAVAGPFLASPAPQIQRDLRLTSIGMP